MEALNLYQALGILKDSEFLFMMQAVSFGVLENTGALICLQRFCPNNEVTVKSAVGVGDKQKLLPPLLSAVKSLELHGWKHAIVFPSFIVLI